MDKKTKFILLGVVVLLGIGIFIYSQKSVLPPSLLEPEEEVALPEDKDVPVDEEVKEEIEKVREKIRLEEGLELASCLIFEKEEYCQKGEIYEREGDVRVYDPEKGELVFIRKETYRDLIFSLPAGIKVYSPMAGFVQGQEFGIDPVTGETMNIVDLLVPPDKDGRKFLVSIGAVSSSDLVYSLLALYLIGNPRSGIAVAVSKLIKVGFHEMILLICVIAMSAGIGVILTLKLTKISMKFLQKVNYQKLCLFTMVFIYALILLFSGVFGVIIATIAMCVGLIPNYTNVRRTHSMGCLLLPTICFFMEVSLI